MVKVQAIAIYSDNYVWVIIHNSDCYVVDPGDAKPVIAALQKWQLNLKGILITHGHWDHVTGIETLLTYQTAPVWGPAKLNHPLIKYPKQGGDVFDLGTKTDAKGFTAHVIDTPGHTADHVCYHFPEQAWLFCGDVLFSAGCGRVGGKMRDAYQSLQKLTALPKETLVFCTHEYTLDNLRFAQTVEPNNDALMRYKVRVEKKRQRGEPSLPTTIQTEHEINPFLRVTEPELVQSLASALKKSPGTAFENFEQLRLWKNRF